ncbi:MULTISPECIES: TonB-dependent receptor [Sphingobacterium]|uniref:TonB-dependent receptor n=1 Tax=Sphingobacterium TaxID=28453 RepID=UPI0013DB55DD|nr:MULTISPECIES: TonB-dependent receptor [unclassified Sphingobacterium]
MQFFKYIVLLLLISGWILNAEAQTQQFELKGRVKSSGNESLQNATIKVDGVVGTTDRNGHFHIKGLKKQRVVVTVSALGFKRWTDTMDLKEAVNQLDFTLQVGQQDIETVEVLGLTKTQEVNRQAYNVIAIDATKLHNTTLDIAGALDRVAGVRVRESGGLGSNFNLSINGFSGSHVRFFLDGVPMDNFGSSFQINNIPINLAERVEVYKGVVPVWLGSDALGGAVNIVTGSRFHNYMDVSYSYGSFNTHRTTINTAFTNKTGLTFQLNAFQNYSDNNYKVDINKEDNRLGGYSQPTTVKRFNDQYHNETIIGNIGVVDKPYADRLMLGITLGKNYKEIQTGARMAAVFGALHRRGTIIMPTLKYSKRDLIKGLDVVVNGNINLGSEQTIDTVAKRFDWFGDTNADLPATSGERGRTLYKSKNHEGIVTGTFTFRISPRQQLSLNNVFTTFNRTGSDELNPTNNVYERPSKSSKNILGLGYQYAVENLWNLSVFGKMLTQRNVMDINDQDSKSNLGYGLAGSYYVNPNFQLKASYELTNRLPTAYELFGDLENQEANPGLTPERSNNFNVGTMYQFKVNSYNNFSLNAGLIYRYAHDFIYNRLNQNQGKTIADNREGVRTFGADAELRYSYKNWLSAGVNGTFQYLQNMQKYEDGFTDVSAVYLDQMPNIPYLFSNADLTMTFNNMGAANNKLNISYNTLYVHDYWLYWPSRGGRSATDEKRGLPTQFSHDVNLVYSVANGRYNIGLEMRNITDTKLVDNFSLQKPGRAFYLNLRYFINKNHK